MLRRHSLLRRQTSLRLSAILDYWARRLYKELRGSASHGFVMKIFGIPVSVKPTFFLVMALLGYNQRQEPAMLIAWVAVVFVSVLLHELGHALTAKAFGGVPAIELYGLGGLTRWSAEPPLSPLKDRKSVV